MVYNLNNKSSLVSRYGNSKNDTSFVFNEFAYIVDGNETSNLMQVSMYGNENTNISYIKPKQYDRDSMKIWQHSIGHVNSMAPNEMSTILDRYSTKKEGKRIIEYDAENKEVTYNISINEKEVSINLGGLGAFVNQDTTTVDFPSKMREIDFINDLIKNNVNIYSIISKIENGEALSEEEVDLKSFFDFVNDTTWINFLDKTYADALMSGEFRELNDSLPRIMYMALRGLHSIEILNTEGIDAYDLYANNKTFSKQEYPYNFIDDVIKYSGGKKIYRHRQHKPCY